MKISLVQPNLILGDVDKNYKMIEEKIREASKENSDVIVLPEMWNTSFFPKNVKELADKNGESTKKLLSDLSKELNVNIVGGSVANLVGDDLYNTAYVFDRKGDEVASYNKVHLFSPSGEHNVFKAGEKLCIFHLDGVKCGLSICYDVRFVEWIRKNALEDIEIFFLPAAWPNKRTLHWDTLNRARAIENQMFVVCTNSVGTAGDMKLAGHSSIIDPWGEYIVVPDNKEGIKTGEVDFSVIKGIRDSINVFRDRRKELY